MSFTPSVAVYTVKKPNMTVSNGKTLYVGGTEEGNYTKIQSAIDNASDGDTVFVYNGTYCENIAIRKSINLISEDRDTTVIEGNWNETVVYVSANWTNISGFTIIIGYDGIFLEDSNNNTIKNNIIRGNQIRGIKFSNSINNKIIENYIEINGWCGISVEDISNNNYIQNNTIEGNNHGIILWSNNNIVIGNNIRHHYWEGIEIYYSNGNTISGNNISKNVYNHILVDHSNFNNIINNNMSNCNDDGILLKQGSSNNKIVGNNIHLVQEDGIHLIYSCDDNIIYHNNFINNTRNAYDACNNFWDNGISGNYWYDYNGEDKDGDGIGDTPCPISGGGNEDRYPLMTPWSGNHPPNTPEILGKRMFKEGEEGIYSYTIYSTDPDGDYVKYLIDWKDGNHTETNYYASGEEFTIDITIPPLDKGTYIIFKIKAIDINAAESDWALLDVIVSRNKATFDSLFHLFFERFLILEVFLRAMNLLR